MTRTSLVLAFAFLMTVSCKDREPQSNLQNGGVVNVTLDIKDVNGNPSPLIDTTSNRMTADSLINYLKKDGAKFTEVDKLLDLFPAYIFSNYILIHESRSSCESQVSAKNPRLILFDEVTKFVVAFTSDPKGSCYNAIEMMKVPFITWEAEFNKRLASNPNRQAVMLSIVREKLNANDGPYELFGKDLAKPDKTDLTKNTSACTECHKAPRHLPFWTVNPPGASTWPGAIVGPEIHTFIADIKGLNRLKRVPNIQNGLNPQQLQSNLFKMDDLFRHAGSRSAQDVRRL